MNLFEKKMVDSLIDLRENHHVVGVKAEFEAEGTRIEEAMRLKEVVTRAGLELTIKIGGCEALKDLYDAKNIGVNTIVAPMIESSYAMKKYVFAVNTVFSEEERKDIKFLINIETITGFQNLDDMLEDECFNKISGIVIGRTDMARSLNMNKEDVNHSKILDIANQIAEKTLQYNKLLVVGGGVSAQSLPFFKALPANALSKFETRKVIFEAPSSLIDNNADKGLLKAVEFELMWMKNKRDFYKMILDEDAQRLILFESRYKKIIE